MCQRYRYLTNMLLKNINCTAAQHNKKSAVSAEKPLDLLRKLDLSNVDLGSKMDDFVNKVVDHNFDNFITFSS